MRHRLLPTRVVVYYVLGLALFSQSSYEEVMRELTDGLSWASGWVRWPDFGLPADPAADAAALREAWERAAAGRVEIACAGG